MPFGNFLSKNNSGIVKIYSNLFGFPYLSPHIKYPVIEKILNLKENEKILDVGCSQGLYTMNLAKKYNCDFTGIDLDDDAIKKANYDSKKLGLNCNFYKGSIEQLPFKDDEFDKILCLDILEHIKDDENAVNELQRVLKNRGKLVISVPHKKSFFIMNLPYNKVNHIKGGHVRRGYDFENLKRILEENKFEVIEKRLLVNLFGGISWYLHGWFSKNKILNLASFPLLLLFSKLDKLLPFYITKELLIVKAEKSKTC